jgi:hypothetical protein
MPAAVVDGTAFWSELADNQASCRQRCCDPFGVDVIMRTMYRGNRCAQPPANGYDPSGVERALRCATNSASLSVSVPS